MNCLYSVLPWKLEIIILITLINSGRTDSPAHRSILKPSSNWSLVKLIIFDQTLIKVSDFLPIYVHFNVQTFSSVFEQFSFTSKFFGLEMQKSTFFKDKMVKRVVFIKLTLRWLQTGLSDLKNTKQLKFCLGWITFRDF